MSLFDFVHKFFNHGGSGYVRPPENNEDYSQGRPNGSLWDPQDRGDDIRDFSPFFNFEIMMDPFKMQRLFEEKFQEMFKDFPQHEKFFDFEGSDLFQHPELPAIKAPKDPRDECLKPGLGNKSRQEDGIDVDSNAKSKPFTLLDLLPKPESDINAAQPRVFSSFSSVTRKTIRLPDGSLRTEEIRRNPDGSEERTESHSLPNGNEPHCFDSPSLEFPGFQVPQFPSLKPTLPRDQFLKPSYENLNPSSEKVDKDLDKQILESGLENLPVFSKESRDIESNPKVTYKSFTKKVITLPNGVVEAEQVIRNPDGTEERTVTKTFPDQFDTNTIEAMKKDSFESNRASSSFAFRGIKELIDTIFK